MEVGEEVVDCLGEDAGPVDGVDGAEAVFGVERFVGEERFDDVLEIRGRTEIELVIRLVDCRRAREEEMNDEIRCPTWQSSNVPLTATLCTLGSVTVVICASWMGDTRPFGWRIKIDMLALFRRP